MKADKYYGSAATNYDAARRDTLRWAKEQVAVASFVTKGPVLDCPLGTGRYVDIYRDKGLDVVGVDISTDMLAEARRKFPDLDAREGTVFELPFDNQSFGTAVCTRLLDWLVPGDMMRAIVELRRVALELVVSIRYGVEEIKINQTHDINKFYQAIDGLYIAHRAHTETTQYGVEKIFHLRPPTWNDVHAQFQWHGHTPHCELERLACEWVQHIELHQGNTWLRAEYWSAERLGSVIDSMAATSESYLTDQLPRNSRLPVTLLKARGQTIVLDGRRRINQWRRQAGLFPVLLLTYQGQ